MAKKRTAASPRPGMFKRWRPLVPKLVGVACIAMIWNPLAQCLWLNIMDPWFTQTMVEQVWKNRAKTGKWRLPTHKAIDIDTLPAHVALAPVASEDQHFFEHKGFDWKAISHAWEKYQKSNGRGKLRGGSTLSQQVARNVFLWQERSWLRKGLEAWYTFWLELVVPKRRILELYLNIAETGPMTFGFEAGAQQWFHKPAKKLSPEQAATLASLLPSPRKWKPEDPRVKRRRDWVLQNPVEWPKPGKSKTKSSK